jgi:alpha-beta hydrolase superfamily lysophospholipase
VQTRPPVRVGGPYGNDAGYAASTVAYPASMPSIVRHVTAADGTDLLVRHWPIDEAEAGGAWAGPTWGSVLLVHGLGEHSGRYEHVGDQLTGTGLEVAAYDHRGMGGSGGRRGDVEHWSQYHDDLAERLAVVRVGAGRQPVVLYGHSLGGLIVAGYLLSDRSPPDLAVLTSPALDSSLPGWKKRLAPVLARVAPTIAIKNDIDGSTLSRDPTVAARTVDDPSCVKVSTGRFGAEALIEQARVRRECTNGFGRPVLVLHGEDDGLVPVAASAVLASAPQVERRTYPGLRHELHNEPEGSAIIDEVIAWLRERATIAAQPNIASGERISR